MWVVLVVLLMRGMAADIIDEPRVEFVRKRGRRVSDTQRSVMSDDETRVLDRKTSGQDPGEGTRRPNHTGGVARSAGARSPHMRPSRQCGAVAASGFPSRISAFLEQTGHSGWHNNADSRFHASAASGRPSCNEVFVCPYQQP
jgi:hypothetical protein